MVITNQLEFQRINSMFEGAQFHYFDSGNTTDALKLYGGSTAGDGSLLYNTKSVCPTKFGLMDANVICKDLCGDGAYGSVLRGKINFPKVWNLVTYPYGAKDINCAGTEATFELCPKDYGACAPTHAVGIRCHDKDSGASAGISQNKILDKLFDN